VGGPFGAGSRATEYVVGLSWTTISEVDSIASRSNSPKFTSDSESFDRFEWWPLAPFCPGGLSPRTVPQSRQRAMAGCISAPQARHRSVLAAAVVIRTHTLPIRSVAPSSGTPRTRNRC
jgi:hypothetical protein